MRVARSRLHLEDAVLDRQQRHIEGAAVQIEDQNALLTALLVQTVRDGGFDDTHHVQSSNHTSVLRRLTLRVVEVRRHRNSLPCLGMHPYLTVPLKESPRE